MADTYYLTTPIFYVNDAPHIGHAYTTVAADVATRWQRQCGKEVRMLTGTDEHGQKVMRAAQDRGYTPTAWVDKLVEEAWLPMLDTINVANDDFIRTTQARHHHTVQTFIQQLHDAGEIYQGAYEGYYSIRAEEFMAEDEIEDGTGEHAGKKVRKDNGEVLEWVSEENYFFRLSKYTQPLLDLYEAHPEFIQPASARNEIISFVKQGLADLSVSRSTFDWGIPLPWDERHVLYVWFDALLNYITAVGYGVETEEDEAMFAKWWPAQVHIVGKDILRFHSVIWPAMLMAAGLPLPQQVFAHGWLLVGGEKMSKSKLNGIAPGDVIDTFGSDAFRYYFLRAIHFGQDGSFSWEDMTHRYNSELANGLGNLASRAAAMVQKYCDGLLPESGPTTPAEEYLHQLAQRATATADEAISSLAFDRGINAVKELVEAVNLYVTEQAPWELAKDPQRQERLHTVLYTICESLRIIAVLYHPIMPIATERLWLLLDGPARCGDLADQRIPEVATWGQLSAGSRITKGESLFPRLEVE